MNQELKDLFIKDLSARLPYGVKFECNKNIYTAKGLDLIVTDEGDWEYAVTAKDFVAIEIDFIKPYLFPLSSISEEIMDEIYSITSVYDIDVDSPVHIEVGTTFEDLTKIFDILNKHHIDYRGMIEKGLALDATGLNIY
jgi:hypothetical protein